MGEREKEAAVASSNGWARIVVMTALAIAAVAAGPKDWLRVEAQGPVSPRQRARTLLDNGIDCYRQADYEQADTLLKQAQAGVAELSASERADLENYLARNSTALQGRRDGVMLLHQLEHALSENRTQDAIELAKKLTVNQIYLGTTDKEKATLLLERVRSRGGVVAPAEAGAAEGAGTLARAKLEQSRKLLAQANFDAADQLAQEVEAMHVTFGLAEDNPHKVREDIKLHREDAKFLFNAAREAYKVHDLDRAEHLAKEANAKAKITNFPFIWSDSPGKLLKEIEQERTRTAGGARPAESKDTPPATQVVKASASADLPPTVPPAVPPGGKGNEVGARTQADASMGAGGPIERAEAAKASLQMMEMARKSLQEGKVEVAEQMVVAVRGLNPDTKGWPENLKPDSVMADIKRARVAQAPGQPADPKVPPAPTGKEDPRALVKQAHDLYDAGRLDEAAALANRARSANVKWGLFEENPESLLNKIAKDRAKRDRIESVKVLAEARKQLEAKNFEEARKLVCKAQQLHGDYPIYELGDRPTFVLDDIRKEEQKQKGTKVPPLPADMAQKQPTETKTPAPAPPPTSPVVQNPAPPSKGSSVQLPPPNTNAGFLPDSVRVASNTNVSTTVPAPGVQGVDLRTPPWDPNAPNAPVSDQQHQRSAALLQQGKALEAQGRLIEARQCYEDAKKLLGPIDPRQDDPAGWALIMLRNTAYIQVKTALDAASEAMRSPSSNPARTQKVMDDLARARQVAEVFQLDVAAVDQRIAWVNSCKTGAFLPEPSRIPEFPEGTEQGKSLMHQGYMALTSGDLVNARQFARLAYKEEGYKVRRYAQELLQRIDDEELNQKRMAEAHNYDAGVERYRSKDFAAAFGILSQVNPRMLDGSRQQSLRELLNSPEMQPRVVQVKAQDTGSPTGPAVAGQRTVADHLPPSDMMNADILKKAEMQQDLLVQKLQARSREVQSQAIKLFGQGEDERAIEVLKEFRSQLCQEELSQEKLAFLRRPIENRIQQYNTLKVQMDFEKHRKDGDHIEYGNRSHNELAQQLKDKKVAELMGQFETFYKDGKYADAERVAYLATELDHDNEKAQAAEMMARMEIRVMDEKRRSKVNEKFNYEALEEVYDEGPYPDAKNPLNLNRDFYERTKNRKQFAQGIAIEGKNPVEKQIEQKLYSPVPSSLQWKDTPLDRVLDDLKNWEGINVFLDRDALKEMGISPEAKLSFEIGNGATLQSALTLMLSQLKLTHVIQNEALVITTEQRARGKLVQKVFTVADLVTPHQAPSTDAPGTIAGLKQLSSTVQDNGPAPVVSGQSGTALGTYSGSSSNGEWQKKAVTNTMEQELIRLITGTIQRESWFSMGGTGTIEYYPIGSALVINQTPDIIEQVQQLLDALRRLQDVEVSVELRIVSVADNFFERIGVDFSMNILLDNKKFQPQLLSGQFAPPGFVNSFQPNGFLSGLQQPGVFTTDLNLPISTSSFQATPTPTFGFPGTGTVPFNGGLDVGLAFLSDVQLYMFLEAVQYDQRNHIMQAPKLMMFNGQTGTLVVGANQLLMTNLTVQNFNGQIVVTPTVTSVASNVTLTIVPIVSADRRFVRLDINQTMTNLSPVIPLMPITTTITQQLQIGNPVQPPILFTNFIQQPTFDNLAVSTSVNVPDGGTVVMGGFKRLAEGRNEAGPPILGKIPYLSRLFRNVSYGRQSEHLIMLVTPRIIITEEEEIANTGVVNPLAGGGLGP